MYYSNLMTIANELENDIDDTLSHAKTGEVHLSEGESVVKILAPAKILTDLLNNADAPKVIDFLSIDVEGAEIEVLKGIDYKKYQFKYILIESRFEEKIENFMSEKNYELIEKLSNHDYLYRLKNKIKVENNERKST